ncbi:MAG: LamG-like jellyroll fold domain-containing protein, partial [Candidatus Kariarchaeaceae archaeon]
MKYTYQYFITPLLFFISMFTSSCEKSIDPKADSDSILPTVTITSPSVGSIVSDTVLITCDAYDNEGVEKVELWVDGEATGLIDDTEPYSFSWNTTIYIDGSSHVITVRAYDINGNTSDCEPVTLIVDNSNYALQFDGVDGKVKLTNSDMLGLTNNTFTVESWIKISEYNSYDQPILGGGDYRLHFVIREQKPYMGFWGNDLAGNTIVSVDTWYHLAWRYNISTGEQAIFVNGQLDISETGHDAYQHTDTLYIGGGWGYFNGQIDEFR